MELTEAEAVSQELGIPGDSSGLPWAVQGRLSCWHPIMRFGGGIVQTQRLWGNPTVVGESWELGGVWSLE